jgi:hypothetical protein
MILDEYANTASAGSIIAFHRTAPTSSPATGRDLLLRRRLLDRPSRFGTAARGQVCSAINNAWLGCGTA